jgi:hypothetical protein
VSATGRGAERIPEDAYQTPGYCVDALLPFIAWPKVGSFLEPCRGAGAIYGRVSAARKEWCEISEGRDYLTARYPARFDLIITNPPFSRAMEFLIKSLDEADTVIYLMRVNMLGAKKRRDFWNRRPPSHLFPLAKRPSFKGNGTDATEYAWFAWDRGGLIRADRWLTVL